MEIDVDNFIERVRTILRDPEYTDLRNRVEQFLLDLVSRDHSGTYAIDHRSNDELNLSVALVSATRERGLRSRLFIYLRDKYEKELGALSATELGDRVNELGMDTSYSIDSDLYELPFYIFIRYTPHLSGPYYRLTFQRLRRGFVTVTKEMLIKVSREAFVDYLRMLSDAAEENKIQDFSGFPRGFPDTLVNLYRAGSDSSSQLAGHIEPDDFPPCVKEMIKQIRDGVNLSHMARFAIVGFLHHIGASNKVIMGVFKQAPDFNESMTKYQVDHITGLTSGTEYTPPRCLVLQSNHLCYKEGDTLCNQEWLKHPLQYYKIKNKARLKNKKESKTV